MKSILTKGSPMRFLKLALAALFLATQSIASVAQVYPVTTPVYIPSAVEQPTVCNTTCFVTFIVSGVSTVSFQLTNLTGTITASLQGTNEAPSVSSNTWTTLNLTPFGGGSTVTSVSATGMWTANTTGLTKVRVNVSALSTGPVTVNLVGASGGTVTFSSNSVVLTDVEANIAPGTAPAKAAVVGAVYNSSAPTLTNGQTAALQETASGQLTVSATNLEMGIAPGTAPAKALVAGGVYNSTPPTVTNGQTAALQIDNDGTLFVSVREFGNNQDPCESAAVKKSSVAVNISSATTTQLVALSGSTSVYVCGFAASMLGTTPAATLEYGTGTNCGTGTTTLTGAIAPTSGSFVLLNVGGPTVVTGASGNALCLLSGGTTPSIQGVLTYVQQ